MSRHNKDLYNRLKVYSVEYSVAPSGDMENVSQAWVFGTMNNIEAGEVVRQTVGGEFKETATKVFINEITQYLRKPIVIDFLNELVIIKEDK